MGMKRFLLIDRAGDPSLAPVESAEIVELADSFDGTAETVAKYVNDGIVPSYAVGKAAGRKGAAETTTA